MTLQPDAVPYLPRGVRLHDDRVRGIKVLLAPERALKLDATGAAILGELDGTTTFGALVATLAARYDAPEDRIAEDAARFLAGLIDRRLVEVRP
jgi:pyrroloquinoline quinone biosynthesis protein D